ncbi:hypothetical protein C8J56DRAFT_1039084 [Mycena floridula]|nr:hypothetical protein C8J56DRAFT_1039084 [Mycena floridula]
MTTTSTQLLHPYATIPLNSFSEYRMETPDSGPFEFNEQIPVRGMPGNESEFLCIYNYDFETWDRIPNGFWCPNLTHADLAEVNKYLCHRHLEHVESDDDDSTVSPDYLPNQNDAAQEKMDNDEDRELDKEEALGEDKKDKAEGIEEEEDTESVHGESSKEDDLDSETSGTDDDDDNDQKSIILDGLASFFRDAAESLKSGEPVDFSSILALRWGKGSKKLYQHIDKMFGLVVETIAEGLAAMTNWKKHTIMLQSGLVQAEEREGSSWTVFKSVYCRSSEAAEWLKGLSLKLSSGQSCLFIYILYTVIKQNAEVSKKLHEDGKNIQSDLLHVIEDFTRQTQHVTALHGDIQIATVISYTGPNPAVCLASAIVLGTDSMVEILQESKISPTEVVDSWTTPLRAKQIDLCQAVGFDVVPSEVPAGNDVAEPKVSKSTPQASAPVQETSAAAVNLAVPTIKSMQDYAKYCKDRFKTLLMPEPDELEDDVEAPPVQKAKAKKGGKPSPSPAPVPKSPIDKAQRELSPRPRSPLPAASPCNSPKPTSPRMPMSKPLSEHQLLASPHKLFMHLFLSLNPEPLHLLSPTEMNLLQLGADDLNYWGYAIEIMYCQLLEAENQTLQVTLITTIASMFQQQKDFAIANACQEMDFPETSYILQLRFAVMRWFQDSHFPEARLPSNTVEISMGLYLVELHGSSPTMRKTFGPILSKGYISLLGEDPTKNNLIRKAVRLGEASDEDSDYDRKQKEREKKKKKADPLRCKKQSHSMAFAYDLLQLGQFSSDSEDDLVDGPSHKHPWQGGTAPPLTGEHHHFFTNTQKVPFDGVDLPCGFVRTQSADPMLLVVPTTQQLRSLRDELGPFTVGDCMRCLQLDLPCAASTNPGGACSRCLSDCNSGLCSHQMFFADVERSFSKTYQIVEANLHKLCRKAIELFSVEARVSATRVLVYQGKEELDTRRRRWLRLYRHIALSSNRGAPAPFSLGSNRLFTLRSHQRNVFPPSITDSDSDDEFSQPEASSLSVLKKKSKDIVEEEEGDKEEMADGEDKTPRASTRDLRPRQGGSVATVPRPVPTPTSKRSALVIDSSDSETSLSSKRQKTGSKDKGKAKATAAEDD